jgi:hypothetical protein
MNNIKKITSFSFVAGMFLIAALATSTASRTGIAFAQNMSNQTAMNQTASAMNQTASQMNQTAPQAANETATKQPKLTTSDIQDIRKSLEDIRKSIADGKAVDALKSINDVDQKLLVAMSANPPPMLEKSSEGNK